MMRFLCIESLPDSPPPYLTGPPFVYGVVSGMFYIWYSQEYMTSS